MGMDRVAREPVILLPHPTPHPQSPMRPPNPEGTRWAPLPSVAGEQSPGPARCDGEGLRAPELMPEIRSGYFLTHCPSLSFSL